VFIRRAKLTNQCTRIATLLFYNDYMPAKKWGIGANLADSQSRDFKRYTAKFHSTLVQIRKIFRVILAGY
jgi:hypothetical protein